MLSTLSCFSQSCPTPPLVVASGACLEVNKSLSCNVCSSHCQYFVFECCWLSNMASGIVVHCFLCGLSHTAHTVHAHMDQLQVETSPAFCAARGETLKLRPPPWLSSQMSLTWSKWWNDYRVILTVFNVYLNEHSSEKVIIAYSSNQLHGNTKITIKKHLLY